MFEKTIIIPQKHKELNLNFGEIAESILFYNQVNLYLKDLNIEDLFKTVPLDSIIELIDYHGLHIFYTENHLQIFQRPAEKDMQIGLGFVKNKIDKDEFIDVLLKTIFPQRNNLTKYIQKLNDRIETYSHPENTTSQILDSFLSKEYTDFGLNTIVPNNEVLRHLNISFYRDNKKRYKYKCNYLKQVIVQDESGKIVTLERIFDPFVFAEEQLILASHENCNISTSPMISQLMRFKTENIIKSHLQAKNFEAFKEAFLPEFSNISESINNNPNKLNDFIKVLNKSKGIKNWLKNADLDSNLISDFYQKTTEKTWIDKLPSKGTRFLIFTGAGILADSLATGGIGTAIGTLLGAGDNFLLDKLLNKWNPSFQLNQGYNEIKRYIKK